MGQRRARWSRSSRRCGLCGPGCERCDHPCEDLLQAALGTKADGVEDGGVEVGARGLRAVLVRGERESAHATAVPG